MQLLPATPPVRLPTGISGLDTLLHGGFLEHGVYLLIGRSGAGKTTLANQIAFHQAQRGSVVYVTVLAETHTRLLGHISQFRFFKSNLVGSAISYLSGYQAFHSASYQGVVEMIRPVLRQQQPTLLVVDGIPLDTPDLASDLMLKDLFHQLQTYSEFTHCTTLILCPTYANVWESRALMLVDGALELTRAVMGTTLQRTLEVQVFRGGLHQVGRYLVTMDESGVHVAAAAPAAS